MDERSLVRVNSDMPLEMLAPLGRGIQTGAGTVLNVLRPEPGSSLVVFGFGGVGLAAIMAPEHFIPALVRLYELGRFPLDRLIRHYPFEQIEQAAHDTHSGTTIKPVLTYG